MRRKTHAARAVCGGAVVLALGCRAPPGPGQAPPAATLLLAAPDAEFAPTGPSTPGTPPARAKAPNDLSTAPVVCHYPEPLGPSIVSETDYGQRYGAAATRFSELTTSRDAPLEECGIHAAMQRMALLRCEDDTNPFAGDLRRAHDSRRGNVGPGGRCAGIIDVYEVPCPERRYELFVDIYFCSETSAPDF